MRFWHLWYVGDDLVGHAAGVQRVLQGHPSLETLSETLRITATVLLTAPPRSSASVSSSRAHPDPSLADLLVVDVDGDPLAKHQLHARRVAQLHCGLDDKVNALVGGRDPIEVHRVVDGRVPGAGGRHLEGRRDVTSPQLRCFIPTANEAPDTPGRRRVTPKCFFFFYCTCTATGKKRINGKLDDEDGFIKKRKVEKYLSL